MRGGGLLGGAGWNGAGGRGGTRNGLGGLFWRNMLLGIQILRFRGPELDEPSSLGCLRESSGVIKSSALMDLLTRIWNVAKSWRFNSRRSPELSPLRNLSCFFESVETSSGA